MNALAALAAAHAVGVDVASALPALARLPQRQAAHGSDRRRGGITVYDDFAHHPTAIATTLAGLRARSAMRASWSAWSRAPTRCGWARMRTRWRRRSTTPTRSCSCSARNWHGTPAGRSPRLRGDGVAAPDVDALIAALRAARARGRPRRVHVQRRLRRRAAPISRRACSAADAAGCGRCATRDRRRPLALFPLHDRAGAGRRAGAARVRAALSRSGARLRAQRRRLRRLPDPRRPGSRRAGDAGGVRHRGAHRGFLHRRRRPADACACAVGGDSTCSARGCATTA